MSSAQKVALITGGGTGIGKASALALAKDGYAIVLAGRRKEPLEKTDAEVKKLGVKTLIVADGRGQAGSGEGAL